MNEYALYKGDTLLAIGTMKEIAETLKIKVRSVMYYKTPSYKKRNKGKNHRELIKLED